MLSNKKGIQNTLSYEGISKVVKILIFSDILITGSFGLVAPIFAVFITNNIIGGSLEIVGIASAIYLLTKSLGQLVIAEVIEKIQGEKDDFYLEFFGALIAALVYLFFPLITTIPQLYMAMFILGMSAALTFPSWVSLFKHHLGKTAGSREWNIYYTIMDIIGAATAAIGGFIAATSGFKGLFVIIGTMGAVGAFALFAMKKDLFSSSSEYENKDIEDTEKKMKAMALNVSSKEAKVVAKPSIKKTIAKKVVTKNVAKKNVVKKVAKKTVAKKTSKK